MSTQTIVNLLMIASGAIVMLVSISRSRAVMQSLPFVPRRHRRHIECYLRLHRGLMGFFLVGYISVAGAIALELALFGETFVSVIFLSGAIFVLIGIVIQSRLLSEVQRTLQGIVPICSRCKKVRTADGNPRERSAWKEIEEYISDCTDADFSHGYCPGCFETEMACWSKKQEG